MTALAENAPVAMSFILMDELRTISKPRSIVFAPSGKASDVTVVGGIALLL
ncbi:hypothetical protein D3C87_1909720 [compost metagenome]